MNRPTPTDIIAARLMVEADYICRLSPRPMEWFNLDANVRRYIAVTSLNALELAGYRIVHAAKAHCVHWYEIPCCECGNHDKDTPHCHPRCLEAAPAIRTNGEARF